jgi:hypothetical protein
MTDVVFCLWNAGFFPSYGVMRSCVEHWRNTGNPSIWDRVCASKHAVVEPTGKEEFREAFKEFNDALEVTKADGSNKNGAAFFRRVSRESIGRHRLRRQSGTMRRPHRHPVRAQG